MPRKKSNKKKKRDAKESKTPSTPNLDSNKSPNNTTPTTSKRTLFADSPSVKSSTKNATRETHRLLDLIDQWTAINKESEELVVAMSGLTTRMAAFRRLESIPAAARTDVLVLFEDLHNKVIQRHIEDLEDVFHNLHILLEKYNELAVSFRHISNELQIVLQRIHHDISLDEMVILFGRPSIQAPVPFETVVRAADHISKCYTQEYWLKMDIVSSVRLDNIELVDSLMNEWRTASVINNEIVDAYVTQLECIKSDTFKGTNRVVPRGSPRKENRL